MRCGLIGEHLGHSFSAVIHGKLADYAYGLYELAPEEVEAFVREGGLDAFNVTIPYKKAVMPYLDRISPEALRIGAVNTVVRRADGSLDGYNTDYYGFDLMLSSLGVSVKGKKVLVLGSGGASATARTVLTDRGAEPVIVVGRRLENNYENLYLHRDAAVVVNTTPVGMYPDCGASPISLAELPRCEAVLDVIYNPARTALLAQAESLGIPNVNGLYMLVAQAVRAYELFTGETAEPTAVSEILSEVEFETKNIILIGMPGCGKTTVGKKIAELLGREFSDADAEFTRMHGLSPAEAIEKYGEEGFRKLEHATICRLCCESGRVIATGGGAVTKEYNYAPIRQNGTVVYLRRDISRLATVGRPLSVNLEELYLKRKDAYEGLADLTVDSTEVAERTARLIIDGVRKGTKNEDFGYKRP